MLEQTEENIEGITPSELVLLKIFLIPGLTKI
jgi:hypothetical protein